MTDIPKLFDDLGPLIPQTEAKRDPHENLTDVLEIIAVARGLRRAHLQGQGHHDAERLGRLAEIAARHGLKTMPTKTLIPFLWR